MPIEDSYLDLLADTLSGLELPARGQFLQRYFHTITHLDLQETQCVQLWDEMLLRRRELSDCLNRPVALKTALVDVLASAGMFRVPIIMEYDALKELQLNAVTDALTGLYNRRLFGESFEKELNRARRYGQPLGLVILDLHRFKEVNDTHGHPRGDEVLRAAAATLKNALRTSDSAFRIGGDEFALLLPQTDAPQALALSRRVETIFAENLKTLQVSVSVNMDHGVSNFPQDGEHADQLIRVADERLYRLKHASHGRSAGSSAAARAESADPRTEAGASRDATAPARPSHETPEHRTPRSSTAPPVFSPSSNQPATSAMGPGSGTTAGTPNSAASNPSQNTSHGMQVAAAATASGMASGKSTIPNPSPNIFTVVRKAERVSMTGTNAYAVLGEEASRRARVLDLGFGGVALEMDAAEELPASIFAVLHVPILPPVRVNLKQVWSQRTAQGTYRVGCTFIS
ncbi:MAG: diguanylate cyclase [Candidatus Acidiferrum sp.]